MTVYIFCGPSLSPEEVRTRIDAVCLPPVAQGDVFRVARLRPRAIGIIDGYFERVPAVWHKEILWAMAQGVRVYGSASMGALRAAELTSFGMVGVGWVFEQFRAGVLEDDDEVAVAHGSADAGYLALSEAMVNIRQTLSAAARAGVIRSGTADPLAAIAKSLYYPERSYPLLLQRAAAGGQPHGELEALRSWLPHGQVNQKRTDALMMLQVMRDDAETPPAPQPVGYHFEHTVFWDHVVRFGAAKEDEGGDGEAIRLELLIDELRLDRRAYPRAHDHAALRLLWLKEAESRGMAATTEQIRATEERWRAQRGLSEAPAFEQWRRENGLSLEEFKRLMREEVLVGLVRVATAREVTHRLVDDLLVAGAYGDLLTRARDKQRVLEERGLQVPELRDTGLDRQGLLQWYFDRLGRPVPKSMEFYATDTGFRGSDAFMLTVLREWCYCTIVNGGAASTGP